MKGIPLKYRDMNWHRKHMARMSKRKNRQPNAYKENILNRIQKKTKSTELNLPWYRKFINLIEK